MSPSSEIAENIFKCWQPEITNQVAGPCKCPACVYKPIVIEAIDKATQEIHDRLKIRHAEDLIAVQLCCFDLKSRCTQVKLELDKASREAVDLYARSIEVAGVFEKEKARKEAFLKAAEILPSRQAMRVGWDSHYQLAWDDAVSAYSKAIRAEAEK